jgi:peptidoglycan/xylan/chitin deacetylase (PgdA/CDA1 family)
MATAALQAPRRIEICRYPGGKRLAVTTSFDDGHTFDRRIVEAFNAWGLKGTFNLNSGFLQKTGQPAIESGKRTYLDASEVASVFEGHEVAIHTVTHPWLERLDPSQIATEVLDDRKALEDLVGYPVRGMAYPFGTFNDRVVEILKSLGIVYARTCRNSTDVFPPANPLLWDTTAHQYRTNPTVPELFEKFYSNSRSTGVFFVWGHGYEFHDKDDWDGLERIYKPLSGKSDVWYCTNIALFDYEAARQRLAIAANRKSAFNPSGIPVTLKCDDRFIDVPPGETISLVGES